MGNCCCRTESPCGSAEERSGLLKDDSKVTACAGDTVVVGTCGPDGEDDVRKCPDERATAVPAKPENGLAELGNTQENGPLQMESIQTATPFPQQASKLKENGTRAQDKDVKATPAASDSGEAEILQCTLSSQAEQNNTAEREVFVASNAEVKEEDSSLVHESIPDVASPTKDAVPSEGPAQIEPDTTEHITTSAPCEGDQEESRTSLTAHDPAAKSSEDVNQNDIVSVEPCTAAEATQPVHVATATQEAQPLNCAVTEVLHHSVSECREGGHPDGTESLNVGRSSFGSEHAGLDKDQDSFNPVKEPPETAASAADAIQSLKSDEDANSDPDCATSLKETSGEEVLREAKDKTEDFLKVEEDKMKERDDSKSTSPETQTQCVEETKSQEGPGKEERLALCASVDVVVAGTSASEEEDGLANSEEDLYRGEEVLSSSHVLKVEDSCSLSPAVDILSYSEREWKGNTAKSALIKKGYKEMSQRFSSLRRVRGDNYCALRATLFQVLSHSTHLPAWLQEDDIATMPQQLAAQEGLISRWSFPGECLQGDGAGDAIRQLSSYLELLQNKWREAVDCASAPERHQLCERLFQHGEEELGLLEALKLLMLSRAVELHGRMQAGEDVPLFCWLLFARDSSDSPHAFLSNHLSHVGVSAGLEQVEMFLLGYALQCTIQVYRLYKADTEEFVTYYPDDHKDDWPSVCLVTEDDRHYNVPVAEAAKLQEQLASS